MLKKLCEWIKRPHGWGLIIFYLFTAGCIAGAIVFSIVGHDKSYAFVAYIFYALAALTLGYTVYTIVIFAPHVKRKTVAHVKKHRLAAKILEQYDFKTIVFSSLSLALTVAFAVTNLVGALRYRSVWHASLAGYYAVLVLFRASVIIADRKMAKKYAEDEEAYALVKWKIYLAGGAILIPLEIAMAGAITMMFLVERESQGGMIMAIVNAAYTFYKIIMAIYNLVKAHKFDDPVVQALRNLNFADACMSVVSLTVLMLATFQSEGDTANDMVTVKAIVGFAACVAIIVLAVYMIVCAYKRIVRLKEAQQKKNSETNDDTQSL